MGWLREKKKENKQGRLNLMGRKDMGWLRKIEIAFQILLQL
jgi:hypothetical protein